jgi:hypothetical protein
MQPIYSTDGKLEFQQIQPTNVLIIEVPFEYNKDEILKIKNEIVNPYLIFVYNPNLKEVRTQFIKTN